MQTINVSTAGGENFCKGLVFKARCTQFYGEKEMKNGLGYPFINSSLQNVKRLTLRKRLSCPGCKYCAAIREELRQGYDNLTVYGFDSIEDGKLYRVIMTQDYFSIIPL